MTLNLYLVRFQALQISEMDEVNCYLVGSRFHNKLLGDFSCYLAGLQVSQQTSEGNYYLVGSRLHNDLLEKMKLRTGVWSDPGFTITCWGRGKLYRGKEVKPWSG